MNVYWLAATAIVALTLIVLAQVIFIERRLVDRLAEASAYRFPGKPAAPPAPSPSTHHLDLDDRETQVPWPRQDVPDAT